MKIADITGSRTYMVQKDSYSSQYPALVVEPALWSEGDEWVSPDAEGHGRSKERHLWRSQKGTRAGRYSGHLYRLTGVPILRLSADVSRFRTDNSPEHQIIDSAHDLLIQALNVSTVFQLLGASRNVFGEGEVYRHIKLQARTADGGTRQVTAEFELVRPQVIFQKWDDFLDEDAKERLRLSELKKIQIDREQELFKEAEAISARVSALVGPPEGYDHNGDRTDIYMGSKSKKTYVVTHDLIVRLLELAERSTQ